MAAVKIYPAVSGYLLASHVSAEPAGQAVLSSLGLKAAIQAGMCLGEGTGAAALFPMLDMALTIYSKMDTFTDIKVKPIAILTRHLAKAGKPPDRRSKAAGSENDLSVCRREGRNHDIDHRGQWQR